VDHEPLHSLTLAACLSSVTLVANINCLRKPQNFPLLYNKYF
jgi:hypothetical protein